MYLLRNNKVSVTFNITWLHHSHLQIIGRYIIVFSCSEVQRNQISKGVTKVHRTAIHHQLALNSFAIFSKCITLSSIALQPLYIGRADQSLISKWSLCLCLCSVMPLCLQDNPFGFTCTVGTIRG